MCKSRREIVGALAASGVMLASAPGSRANPVALDLAGVKKETDVACIYHCDFGDPQRFSQMLQNMLNHYSAYEFDSFKLKLVVVVHGAGLKFFPMTAAARRGRTTTSIRSSTSASPASPSTGSRDICARSPTSA